MENEEIKSCAFCKKEVMPDWNWCPFCSSKIMGHYTTELVIDQAISKVIYCVSNLKGTSGGPIIERLMKLGQSITQIADDLEDKQEVKKMTKKCECGIPIPGYFNKCYECNIEEYEKMVVDISELTKLDKAKYSDLLNQIGRARGLSWCNRCQGTWNWKKEKSIYFSKGEGGFPLCEECFAEISFEEALRYYQEYFFNVIRMEKTKYWTDKRANKALKFMTENIRKEKQKQEVKK